MRLNSEFVPIRTRFWYGFGQMAEGVVGAAFDAFVFFYYSQVLGLSPALCGLALMIAIVSDAVTDPLVGSMSDGWKSRLGRRHPFMYAAAVPLGACMVAIFAPPGDLDQWALFAWLTVCAVGVHVTLTAYHIPHMALGAELSSDYVVRTRIVAYRAFFQMASGGAVIPICFAVFFQPSARYENGQLDPATYPLMAICLAMVTIIAIIATSVGTHSRIPHLHESRRQSDALGLRRIFREFRTALVSRSYRALFGGFILLLIGRSISSVLGVHLLTYFWQLSPDQISQWGLAGLVGALAGVPFWALIAPFLGKKQTMLIGLGSAGIAIGLTPLLALWGLFPDGASTSFLWLIYASGFLAQFGFSASMVTVGSMIADLADEHEWLTGHRREGVLFAGLSFSFKLASALAVQLAGFGTAWLGLQSGLAPEAVSEQTTARLALLYGLPVLGFTAVSLAALSFYDLTRERVGELQAELRVDD